jgi:hypothetical protein
LLVSRKKVGNKNITKKTENSGSSSIESETTGTKVQQKRLNVLKAFKYRPLELDSLR